MNTIRIIILVSTKKIWKLPQMDVKLAFWNGVLKEEVYRVQPEGFVK